MINMKRQWFDGQTKPYPARPKNICIYEIFPESEMCQLGVARSVTCKCWTSLQIYLSTLLTHHLSPHKITLTWSQDNKVKNGQRFRETKNNGILWTICKYFIYLSLPGACLRRVHSSFSKKLLGNLFETSHTLECKIHVCVKIPPWSQAGLRATTFQWFEILTSN